MTTMDDFDAAISMVLDPFDDAGGGLQRDRWGRPIILRPWEEDGPCEAARGKRWNCHITKAHGHYTRASTFASTLDDGPALAIWMKRHVALGVAKQPDLRAIIAGMTYADGESLDQRIEEVLERQAARDMEFSESIRRKGDRSTDASLRAANWGTAVHRFTEPYSPPDIPTQIVADVESFKAKLQAGAPGANCPACDGNDGYIIVGTEMSIVNDRWYTAGTFDHAVQCRACSEIFVLDKKTGQDMHPIAMCIQLTAYANGELFDDESGLRKPLPFKLNREHGVIAHIPLGTGRTHFERFDLALGAELTDHALKVRIWRLREKDLHSPLGTTTV